MIEIGKSYRVTFRRTAPGGSAGPVESVIWTAKNAGHVKNLTRVSGLVGYGFVPLRTASCVDDEWSVISFEETPTSYVAVETLKAGQTVVKPDGTPLTVKSVHVTRNHVLIKFETDGRVSEATVERSKKARVAEAN